MAVSKLQVISLSVRRRQRIKYKETVSHMTLKNKDWVYSGLPLIHVKAPIDTYTHLTF